MFKEPPPAPTASAIGPCPTIIQISRTPRNWKFTQHLRTTRPPPRFLETQLPTIEKFHSSLTNERISQKDLNLKTDLTLLADVFLTFRRTCMNAYKLDPLHYYTAPGLSWDALLKYTGIKLELLTDYDQHIFI